MVTIENQQVSVKGSCLGELRALEFLWFSFALGFAFSCVLTFAFAFAFAFACAAVGIVCLGLGSCVFGRCFKARAGLCSDNGLDLSGAVLSIVLCCCHVLLFADVGSQLAVFGPVVDACLQKDRALFVVWESSHLVTVIVQIARCNVVPI